MSATPNDKHLQGHQSIIPLSDVNVQIVQIVVAVSCCVSQPVVYHTFYFVLYSPLGTSLHKLVVTGVSLGSKFVVP